MKDFFVAGALAGAVIGMLVMLILVYPAIGYLIGTVVGWVFSETSNYWLDYFGLDINMGQIGATLAWIGGFFKSTNSTTVEKS